MKRFTISAVCFLVCFLVAISSGEIYRGIRPWMTLGEVKGMFPGAIFKKLFPAWAQEDDAMYSVTGTGIEGEIIIKFNDTRPWNRRLMEQETDNNWKEALRKTSEESEDISLMVSWVRWVPDAPFPVARMITKYGKPEKSDFFSTNFKPFKSWESKGITAHLTDDGKNVYMIDFNPTKEEAKEGLDIRVKFYRETLELSPKRDVFDEVSDKKDGKEKKD